MKKAVLVLMVVCIAFFAINSSVLAQSASVLLKNIIMASYTYGQVASTVEMCTDYESSLKRTYLDKHQKSFLSNQEEQVFNLAKSTCELGYRDKTQGRNNLGLILQFTEEMTRR
jgi:hypothetical protein